MQYAQSNLKKISTGNLVHTTNNEIKIVHLKYQLQREAVNTSELKKKREQIRNKQIHLEREERERLLSSLPRLTQTRLMMERLQSKASKVTNRALRAQYATQYNHLQVEYNEQSSQYNQEVAQFEFKSAQLRREIDAFNMRIEKHNRQIMQDNNRVERYEPEQEDEWE